MSTTIPLRYNGNTIDASWFNLIKTALSEVIFTPLTITANKTADATNNLLLVDATSNSVEVALPASTGNSGRVYYVKALNVTNAVTINPNTSETIDGAPLYTFSAANESVACVCDGAKWVIISSNNAVLNSSSIISPDRLDVKQDTYSNLSTYASTASNGQLCFSTDTKKMYQVVDGALTELGSGSGTNGDAETIHLIRSGALTNISEVDLTGNNAAFDGGGTITSGALSLSTTAADLILGTSVIKYAPAANGQNDYFGFTKAIPQGQRGRSIGFSFEYKNDSTVLDNDFTFNVKIKDGASAGYIYTDNLTKYYTTNNESVRFSQGYFVPADCTEIEFGWRNTDTTTTVVLMVDNILVSANPFVYKNLFDTQYVKYDTYGGYGSTNNKIPYFTTLVTNAGTQCGVVSNSATLGFSFTATKKCTVTMVYAPNSNSATGAYWGISINSTQLTTDISSITAANRVAVSYTATSTAIPTTITGVVDLNPGDVIRPHNSGSANAGNTATISIIAVAQSEHVVAPTTSAIEEVYYDGYLSRDGTTGFLKLKTRQRSTASAVISESNSGNYTVYTARKKATVFLSSAVRLTAADSIVLRHYNSAGTLKGNVYSGPGNTSFNMGSSALSAIADAGDYFVVWTPAYNVDSTITMFSIVAVDFYQMVLSAIPVQQNCYIKDVKGYNVSGGNVTGGVYYVRDLNVINETGSNTTGSCSFATLASNQFTLQPGTYDIDITIPFSSCGTTLGFLRDTSAGTNDVFNGIQSNGYDNPTYASPGFINPKGTFTISSPKTFEVKMYANTTRSDGLGIAHSISGYSSVYTTTKITKIK
jgi:hypothetical protein